MPAVKFRRLVSWAYSPSKGVTSGTLRIGQTKSGLVQIGESQGNPKS